MSTATAETSRSACHAAPDGLVRDFVIYAATFANRMDPLATKLLNKAAATLMDGMEAQAHRRETQDVEG
jgi:hypothetical protein